MKKTLTIIALAVASFGAIAQDSSSASTSGSNSGSTSNASAQGNVNASQSNSGSNSGATSGSTSGAAGNVVIFNPSSAGATATGAGGIPTTRVINDQSGSVESRVSGGTTSTLGGGTNNTNTNSENYNGTLRTDTTGDTTQRQVLSGGVNNTQSNFSQENVHYSGTQTIKNVPAIAMSGPASGPCTGNSGGLGLAGPGWGVGLNGSAVMVDCRLRENLRVIGMAMQSLDGTANPQEKGEATVMFMDDLRALHQYNQTLYQAEAGKK